MTYEMTKAAMYADKDTDRSVRTMLGANVAEAMTTPSKPEPAKKQKTAWTSKQEEDAKRLASALGNLKRRG